MKKVLVIAHLGRHFRIFGHSDYKVLLKMGYEVHIAANFKQDIDTFDDDNVQKHQIDFERNPFAFDNFKALRQLKLLLSNVYFDIIHCQSPSGGAITRLAAIGARKKGTKVIYTAHGLHFFKNAPLKNWLIYFNIEKLLGYFTDCIITINKEDYNAAKEKLRIKDVRYIHGVGIDLDKFARQNLVEKQKLRLQYGYTNEQFILIYAGELSYRKHQDLLIETISILKNEIPNIKLLLAGTGNMKGRYEEQVASLCVQNNVEFLGYRNDIVNLMMIADVAVSSSRQEGLPVNVMEAMATGLPIVLTNCRGNRDLIEHCKNGYIIDNDNANTFAQAISKLYFSEDIRNKFGVENIENVRNFSLEKVEQEMKDIYLSIG